MKVIVLTIIMAISFIIIDRIIKCYLNIEIKETNNKIIKSIENKVPIEKVDIQKADKKYICSYDIKTLYKKAKVTFEVEER